MDQQTDEREIDRVYNSCSRFLTGHYPRSPRDVLLDLAESTDPELTTDHYGKGDLIERFEARVAALLGAEAAVFLASGTMAQQIALRIWTGRRNLPTVAMHARNHLDAPEHFAYQVMHGLRGIVAGSPDRLLTLADLQAIPEPLGAILVELPQREIGGQLPAWDDLVAIAEWARERGIPLHMDGARLWQCRPFYGRAYAEIAGLFDSVYVSFYKIIGGITGSALAGPAGLIEEARVWQWRHGGRLIHAFPLVLSAERGLDERLGRIDAYHVKAVEIASALGAFPDIEVVPDPPHTNMLHVYLRGDRERLMQAALEIAEQHDVFMIYRLGDSPLPRWQKFELTVGDATLDLTTDEIAALFHELFDRASRP